MQFDENEKKIKIVMIEDDHGHAGLIKDNLEEAGVTNEIFHFDNGSEALAAIFENKNDLRPSYIVILLDLNLPDIDGYEILKTLRSKEVTKLTPVCMLTTTSDEREIERCYELGCNVYITKPVEYIDFQEAMKKLGILLTLVKTPQTR